MPVVEKIDRTDQFRRLNERLVVDRSKTALVTIDLQRGNLDPAYATLPVPPEEAEALLGRVADVLGEARRHGLPVIHVVTYWTRVELAGHPFERATLEANVSLSARGRSDYANHKLEGSPGAELMPGLAAEGDYWITSKRTFDSFHGTNLEILLRALGVDTVVLAGVNTNTCVQSTVFGAYNRGLRVIVLSDCTASAYGPDLHAFALENIARRLGWVLTSEEFKQKLKQGG